MTRTDIDEAKRRLPLPGLMRKLGFGEHAKKSARCPFHDDKHNSFSVWNNATGRWFWKCHAGCGEGDEISFIEKHRGLSRGQAIKLYLEMAGVNGAKPPASKPAGVTSTSALDWPACVAAFTDEHLEQLAKSRGYSIETVCWLKENRLIGLHDGCIAFPVHNIEGNVVAAHCRQEDGSWRYYPQRTKVRPLVIGELSAVDPVHGFESQWDAFAFMDKSGEYSDIVITRGASNGALVSELIPERSTVYLWTQNDSAGEKWELDICANTKATVKRVKIPMEHKDLNDWTRAGATADDLLGAMEKAEVLRQAEKNWIDALNESVVTAVDLRDLKLVPRKKLLGDWFCEGDLGFIFAFRGVGKTWLALAIAEALSTGGKLGDWKAHERVKVLYIDSEMPPDLIRKRCDGLEANDE